MIHGFQKQFQMQDICNFFVTNYLFVISKEIIARKQIFQVFNTCYYVQRTLFSTLNLLDPFHTQKESMYLLVDTSVLHFR